MQFTKIDLTHQKILLKRWLGCGTTLIGKPSLSGEKYFRRVGDEPNSIDSYRDYSEVMYHFFTLFFLPIWPVGCYRIGTYYRQEQSFEIDIYKKVINEEKCVSSEIAHIYFHYWGIAIALFLLFRYFFEPIDYVD